MQEWDGQNGLRRRWIFLAALSSSWSASSLPLPSCGLRMLKLCASVVLQLLCELQCPAPAALVVAFSFVSAVVGVLLVVPVGSKANAV
jgi:hypothetical protein